MKNLIMICALVLLPAAFGPTAKAVPDNPANWHWSLQTHRTRDDWVSPTPVDTGYPQYDYTWQIEYVDLQLDGGEWSNIMGYLPEPLVSGTKPGLTFTITDDHWEVPGIFSADIYTYVDEQGWGRISVTNITFGQVDPYTVTGFRYGGTATVEGVPEPATLSFLALGSLALLRKRKGYKY